LHTAFAFNFKRTLARTAPFLFFPRISVALFSQDKDDKNGRWTPLGSFGNPEDEVLHRIISSKTYKRAELFGNLEKPLQD
jgi:hypothetical protein